MQQKYKIFLDTSALLSGLNSPFGASGFILSLFQIGSIEVIVSNHILNEAKAVIRIKFPLLKEKLINFLLYGPTLVKKITKQDLKKTFILIQTEDTPVLAAAIKSRAHFLVTLDKRFQKLVKERSKLIHSRLKVVNPGEFINYYRSQLKKTN